MAETDLIKERILIPLVICLTCMGIFFAFNAITREKPNPEVRHGPVPEPIEREAAAQSVTHRQSLTRGHFSSSEKWIDYIFGIYTTDRDQLRQNLNDHDVELIAEKLSDDSLLEKWVYYCRVLGHLGPSEKSSAILLDFVQRKEDWDAQILSKSAQMALAKVNAISMLGLTRGASAEQFLHEVAALAGIQSLLKRWNLGEIESTLTGKDFNIERTILLSACRGLALTEDPIHQDWSSEKKNALNAETRALTARLERKDDLPTIAEVEDVFIFYGPVNYGLATRDLIRAVGLQDYLGLGWDSAKLHRELRPYLTTHWEDTTQIIADVQTWARATNAGLTVEELQAMEAQRRRRAPISLDEIGRQINMKMNERYGRRTPARSF